MAVVAAFLVPGTPLPMLHADNPPWGVLAEGLRQAGRALISSRPDTLLVYSTQWLAVLDQLWQTAPRVRGLHVDENWHEYGGMKFDMQIDTPLTQACIAATGEIGIRSKEVNYDAFPIDSGTIAANHFLNPEGRWKVTITSNNVYHDPAQTEKLGALAAREAERLGRKVAAIGIGGLSGTLFREEIDIAQDRIASPEDDRANRELLQLLEGADAGALRQFVPDYAGKARADMGLKHFYWVLGCLGGSWQGAKVHAYGPAYGTGAAVVEFKP